MASSGQHAPDDRRDILNQKLQLSNKFCEYVADKVEGWVLATTCIQERSGKGSISVILTYHMPHVSHDHGNLKDKRHLVNRSTGNTKSKPVLSKKKKSPSRRE